MAARIANAFCRSGFTSRSRLEKLSCVRGRKFSTAGSSDGGSIFNTPLSHPLPGVPPPKYAPPLDYEHDTEVTTLETGLRVASEPKHGVFCTVGVLLDSGARYEAPYPSGITHFLEKLSFQSTSKFESRDHILQRLEKHGGICDCQGSKDTLIFAASANSSGLPEVMDILSEVTLRPNFHPEEIEDSRFAIQWEVEALNMNPDPEQLLVEMIHAAAYRSNTLGLPKVTPVSNISVIDRKLLYSYMHNYHTPDRIVVAGVGVDHGALVDLTKQYFVGKKSIWEENPALIDKSKGKDMSISQYTGGLVTEEKDLSNVSLGPNPMPELAHCVIGLESCSHGDDDFVAFCVLNMMMGGGGSFSAGGPGKGMYSRLYLNVLNRLHWIESATAYNHAYMDSGMFCIHASSHPSQSELDRAKTQLQSMLLMNLESRPVMFEDVARQVMARGHRLPATHYFDEIGKITAEDIQRVARRMLQSKPAVAALGNLSQLPTYKDIETALLSPTGKLPERFKLFR